jgi:crossover junction endodeoxyribonuclease RusA
VQITLPWFPKELSPNSRVHWAVKARFARQARVESWVLAREAGYTHGTFDGYDGKLYLRIEYYPKTKNYPDVDNCLSGSKAYLDGIADLLDVNDRRFVPHPMVMDATGGKIVIRITKGPE